MGTKIDKKFLKKYSKLHVKVSTLNILLQDPEIYDKKTNKLLIPEQEFMGILYATDELILNTDVFTQVAEECEKVAKKAIRDVELKSLEIEADQSTLAGFRDHVLKTYRSEKVLRAVNDAEYRIGNADFSRVTDKKDAIMKMSKNLLGSLMKQDDVDTFSDLMFQKIFAQ